MTLGDYFNAKQQYVQGLQINPKNSRLILVLAVSMYGFSQDNSKPVAYSFNNRNNCFGVENGTQPKTQFWNYRSQNPKNNSR